MSNIPQFNIGTAALEHLELLNRSDQNPLEIAAQFRTLLRSKKVDKNVQSPDHDYTYMDYITTNATIRRQTSSDHHQPQSKIQSTPKPPKCETITSNNHIRYPTIDWKQLRKKQYKTKLENFISKKFKTKELTSSSLTTVSDTNLSELETNFDNIILHKHQARSPSPSIRTPLISPIHFSQPNYTITQFNSSSLHNDDIFIPIADCNLIIKHKVKRYSHFDDNKTNEERICV